MLAEGAQSVTHQMTSGLGLDLEAVVSRGTLSVNGVCGVTGLAAAFVINRAVMIVPKLRIVRAMVWAPTDSN